MSDFLFDDQNTPHRSQFGRDTIGDSQQQPPPFGEGDRLGEFVLEKLLGSGGSGFVYRALDTDAGRERGCTKSKRCALKVLRLGDPETIVRNRLGFRGMTQVQHRNLVRVDRIHRLGDYTALAMEEVCGETLSQSLKQLVALPHDQAFATLLAWMRDFAAGLAAMHAAGFIHRDVKPQNLMIDSLGRGRVIDYGLVEKFDIDCDTTQESNFILGTPRYWSPEILYRQRYLPAGDIFALGLVMLESVRFLSSHFRSGHADPIDDGVQRDKSADVDAKLLSGAIDDLSDDVPELMIETCREMLDRHAAERPTAMQIARLGLPPQPISCTTGHEPMIGRELVLQQINRWIDGVFAGRTERLHLSGPSGIGKTRVLDAVIDYIHSKLWGQVFRGRCRMREDAPWQAFEQICDSIANRYSRPDREPIELDPVSAEILHGTFPFLRKTILSKMDLPLAGSSTMRLDSLEAAARFSVELRKVGPLFIVVDDTQWADQDSLNVLDRLQTATGEIGLGVITVSRSQTDRQQIPPHVKIHLGAIDNEPVKACLMHAAEINGIQIDDAAVQELTIAVGGSPFRLQEVAYEFRPGGALSQIHLDSMVGIRDKRPMGELVSIKRLWQSRLDRLSDEAKEVLLFVVTAGGRVSTQQLGELTGQGADVDVAVSDLSRLRLIQDDATGGECIAIFHDRFADQVTATLSDRDKRRANAAWASLLVHADDSRRLAARIAGHWIAAGQPGRAVSHSILAAEDAQRTLAHSEAARWHARVVDHLSGEERLYHIRQAARCYRDADLPIDAARYFMLLAESCEGQERFDCELNAAVLMLRCGQYEMVRERLVHFASELGLPRPKSPTMAKVSLAVQLVRAHRGRGELMRSLTSQHPSTEPLPKQASNTDVVAGINDAVRQRFELCLAIIRPLSMYDNLYAGELSMAASRLARQTGTVSQRINVAVGESVFGSYDRGPKRDESEANLKRLINVARDHGDALSRGDVMAGIVFTHAHAGRWTEIEASLETCIQHYDQSSVSHGFEVAHVRWVGLWADWMTGQWKRMRERHESMFDEAVRRNDLFQQQICCGGLGGNAWLVRDRLGDLKTLRQKKSAAVPMKPGEVMHFMDQFGMSLDAVYEGDLDAAWRFQIEAELDIAKLPLQSYQLARIMAAANGALVALHHFAESQRGDSRWEGRVRKRTLALRHERLPYARMLANFYDGSLNHLLYLYRSQGDENDHGLIAIDQLRRAADEADSLGLWPIKWAAEDAIARLSEGDDDQRDSLAARMLMAGVIRPDRLSRLYTAL